VAANVVAANVMAVNVVVANVVVAVGSGDIVRRGRRGRRGALTSDSLGGGEEASVAERPAVAMRLGACGVPFPES